jgi:hypothetical protein
MNSQPETTITTSNSAPLHCLHRTATGRRCRMPVADLDSGLCFKHAADRRKELDQADLASALIGDIQEFRDALTINHSLGELYKLQARNKITPRRAAVMAYTANLLLRTLPAINDEQKDKVEKNRDPLDDFPPHLQEIILQKRRFAAEAYARSRGIQANCQPEDAGRALYKRMSSHSVPNNGDTPSSTNTKEPS